ncbi:MAG: TRAP transporter small permease [Treponemataceae bacterium]
MEAYKKFVGKLNFVAKSITFATLTVMTVMIVLQVVFRYVLQSSLSFSEELARYMFIWSAFVGTAIALRSRSHVSIEIIVANLPKPIKRRAIAVTNSLSFIFYALLTIFGFIMMLDTAEQTSPALGISMALVYLCVPIAGFILMANVIVNASEEIADPDIIKSEGVE